ncbi:MAG: tRNA uridine-5-carboxymethylaminomethyl(34) synthesis GTPase MnmE [Pseudomonadota bacterium]
MSNDTIYALSSGNPPSGVAVIRVSGPKALLALDCLTTADLPPIRTAKVMTLSDPEDGTAIDEALVLCFQGPKSFTGEDVVEIQCHGGRAVINALFGVFSSLPGYRIADPGEFTRRAFLQGKLDLVETEGLADLINSETEEQRKLAVRQMGGHLSETYSAWRSQLIRLRAFIEAELDFADEEDVPGSVSDQVWDGVAEIVAEMRSALAKADVGERIRSGLAVVIAGPPNVGKSSLLNALAGREAAIVTDIEGTTRDAIDVHLDLRGMALKVTDTAGIRPTEDPVEKIGIERSFERMRAADIVVWMGEAEGSGSREIPVAGLNDVIFVLNKADRLSDRGRSIRDRYDCVMSINRGEGIDEFVGVLEGRVGAFRYESEDALITRQRHRECVADGIAALEGALDQQLPLEIRAEQLRLASDAMARILGVIDVEDLLDVVFGEFCIGK